MVAEELEQFERLTHGPQESFAARLEDMRLRRNGIIQLSPPRPVLADSAEEAVDQAFDVMIVDEDKRVQHRPRTLVAQTLRSAFQDEPRLRRHVVRRRRAEVDGQRVDHDVAIAHEEALQLSRAWSFDHADMDRLETRIQAWNYTIGLLRDQGGDLVVDAGQWPIPAAVNINAVFRAPSSAEGRRVLDRARRGWSRLQVVAVDESESQSVVQRALDLASRAAS